MENAILELDLKHYKTNEAKVADYATSTFPHPLITIDWTGDLEPIRVLAVGSAIFTVADAIAKGGSIDEILARLIK